MKKPHASWVSLGPFWKRGRASCRRKLLLFNAVIKTRVMYGLESAHLPQSLLSRLNTFQLRGLRQILHMKTSFVNRANSNAKVYQRASQMQNKKKELKPLSEEHGDARVDWYKRLYKLKEDAPQRVCTYAADGRTPVLNPRRRVGRPRIPWTAGTHERAWFKVRNKLRIVDAPDPNCRCQQVLIIRHLPIRD